MRARHDPAYMASKIAASYRDPRVKLTQEYLDGLREINAPPPDTGQSPQTRGPDPIGDDVRIIIVWGLAALAIGFVLTGWKFWPAFEKILGLAN